MVTTTMFYFIRMKYCSFSEDNLYLSDACQRCLRAKKGIGEPLFQYFTEKKCFVDNFLFSLLVFSLDLYLILICYIKQSPISDQKQETENFREVAVSNCSSKIDVLKNL